MSSFYPSPNKDAKSNVVTESLTVNDAAPKIKIFGDESDTSGIYIHREEDSANGTFFDIDVMGSDTDDGYITFLARAVGSSMGVPSFQAYFEVDATTGASLTLERHGVSGGEVILTAGETSGSITIDSKPVVAIDSPANGDIAIYNGSTWTKLTPGTAGTVLMSNGPNEFPSWVEISA